MGKQEQTFLLILIGLFVNLPKGRAYSRHFVYPYVCSHLVWNITQKIQVVSTLSRCAVHKNRNSALLNFAVIALFHFNTLHLLRAITLKLHEVLTRNVVGRYSDWYISLSRSAVHKNSNFALPYFGVITLYYYYTLSFVWDISLKLKTINKKLCR